MDFTLIILPRHSENDLALRLADTPDDLLLAELGMLRENGIQRIKNLSDGLVKLGLTRVSIDYMLIHLVYSSHFFLTFIQTFNKAFLARPVNTQPLPTCYESEQQEPFRPGLGPYGKRVT
jgi:hypothetical protein